MDEDYTSCAKRLIQDALQRGADGGQSLRDIKVIMDAVEKERADGRRLQCEEILEDEAAHADPICAHCGDKLYLDAMRRLRKRCDKGGDE